MTIDKKLILLAGITAAGVVVAAGGFVAIKADEASPERAVADLQAAVDEFDEAQISAATDHEALSEDLLRQLRPQVAAGYEAEVAAAGFDVPPGMGSAWVRETAWLDDLVQDFVSPAAIRAFLQKCDPRAQSDEARRETADVDYTQRRVSDTRHEVICAGDLGLEWTLIMTRPGDRWMITGARVPAGWAEAVS